MQKNEVVEKIVELLESENIKYTQYYEKILIFKGKRRIPDEIFLEDDKLTIPELKFVAEYSDIKEIVSGQIGKRPCFKD